ncbi:PREDICTED: melanoma-associated antigen B10-like [Chrysochloris asiatica]|uniref:Melanoma-associated antigen B10-like n=1 Tax=Chrysochloris asiatica TaxID=185453 RepID=A0A9B0SXN1_CHRAS|nr:PREDICTED: melanoma-associated antigen B10-like [Chrysochloris asiatica]
MLKLFNKKCMEHFSEILKKAVDCMELVSGLESKDIHPNSNSYHFISKMNIAKGRILMASSGLFKTGLVITLLGIIFMNDNHVIEYEIWEFLSVLAIYAGKLHSTFGDPRKFITKDLVKERYLVFQKVLKDGPPCNECLWSLRTYAETTKMKLLDVLAKINNTVPRSLPSLYEDALRDEEEKAQATVVNATASVHSRAKTRIFSPIK